MAAKTSKIYQVTSTYEQSTRVHLVRAEHVYNARDYVLGQEIAMARLFRSIEVELFDTVAGAATSDEYLWQQVYPKGGFKLGCAEPTRAPRIRWGNAKVGGPKAPPSDVQKGAKAAPACHLSLVPSTANIPALPAPAKKLPPKSLGDLMDAFEEDVAWHCDTVEDLACTYKVTESNGCSIVRATFNH